MKALKLRTFSSSSRDNQSNLSTQQDLTYRMIKEVHHLRTHSFNRNTSKRTSLTNHDNVYDNFHMLTLRESLHKNKNYETLLSSPIDLKKSHNSSKKVIDHLNGFTFIPQTTRNKTISISKNKTPKTRNQKYSFFNTVDKFKSLSMNSRAEYLTQFVSRTKEISKEKYIHLLQSGNIQRIENKNYNAVGLVELDCYKAKTSLKLVKQFSSTFTSYHKYLTKQIDIESTINENLKEKKLQIMNDIQRIKKKVSKLRSIVEIGFKNKLFLLCVKNNTTDISKFPIRDRIECQRDLFIIQNINNIQVFSSLSKRKMVILKRFSQIADSDNVIYNRRTSKGYEIFKSIDEFKTHLDNISLSINKLLLTFNKIQNEISVLRKEKVKRRNEIGQESKMNVFFNNEIALCEEKVFTLKSKNKELTEYLKNIPRSKTNYNILKKKICEVYKNINSLYTLNSNRKYKYNINEISYLQDIEIGVISLNKLLNFYKEKYPHQYNEIKEKIYKENKMKLIHELKIKENNKMKLKYENVLNKQHKLTLKRDIRIIDTLLTPSFKKKKKKVISLPQKDKKELLDEELKYCFSE